MHNASAPIGVFDSGLGGLTAVRELRRILPNETIVYFGDTGRVPYGSRSAETILQYARQDIRFLLSQNVKYIVAACGTVSSTLPESESAALPVPYLGVVQSAAAAAVRASKNGRIGVIGTQATILSGSYVRAISELAPTALVTQTACPLFVPLVENGYWGKDCAAARYIAQDYLAAVQAAEVDTLILGCTHYPLLADLLQDCMGSGVTLIDAGRETAHTIKTTLAAQGLLTAATSGSASYFVSDEPTNFAQLSSLFLGEYAGGSVQRVSIETY